MSNVSKQPFDLYTWQCGLLHSILYGWDGTRTVQDTSCVSTTSISHASHIGMSINLSLIYMFIFSHPVIGIVIAVLRLRGCECQALAVLCFVLQDVLVSLCMVTIMVFSLFYYQIDTIIRNSYVCTKIDNCKPFISIVTQIAKLIIRYFFVPSFFYFKRQAS